MKKLVFIGYALSVSFLGGIHTQVFADDTASGAKVQNNSSCNVQLSDLTTRSLKNINSCSAKAGSTCSIATSVRDKVRIKVTNKGTCRLSGRGVWLQHQNRIQIVCSDSSNPEDQTDLESKQTITCEKQ